MERLAFAEELLDGPLDDPETLAGNLRDLARANRWLGGVALTRRALGPLVAEIHGPIRMLDIGTGAADIPLALLRGREVWARRLAVTAIDARAEVLDAARALRPDLDRIAGLTVQVADGTALPFPDGAFDVAHASLVLHHLDRPAAIALLAEMARVARRGAVINDLARSPLALAGAWVLARTASRNPYTRNDAPLSVRRAWRAGEVGDLLEFAGLRPIGTWHGIVRHRYAIAAVPR